MTSVAPSRHWLGRLLKVLPARVLAGLDAWSARVAQRRAERRMQAGHDVTSRTV